ncbi:MAG: PilZ domain-containing protein [Phycisphaerae bacterium]|nr:PilZ domain-containing protein [Phycisphaerae bacterium]
MKDIETFHPTPVMMKMLDALSNKLAQERKSNVNRRWRERKPLKAPCKVFFLVGGANRTMSISAKTRNISGKGLGIVVKRAFHQDEPVEVCLQPAGRPPLFMAGLTRFCRYVADGFFEVGIELMVAKPEAIFANNPIQALQALPWLAESLQRKHDSAFMNDQRRKIEKVDKLVRAK